MRRFRVTFGLPICVPQVNVVHTSILEYAPRELFIQISRSLNLVITTTTGLDT